GHLLNDVPSRIHASGIKEVNLIRPRQHVPQGLLDDVILVSDREQRVKTHQLFERNRLLAGHNRRDTRNPSRYLMRPKRTFQPKVATNSLKAFVASPTRRHSRLTLRAVAATMRRRCLLNSNPPG